VDRLAVPAAMFISAAGGRAPGTTGAWNRARPAVATAGRTCAGSSRENSGP